MKKTVLAIGLVLALSLSAAASFEFYGGGSYNTFDPEALNYLIKLANDELDEWKEDEDFPIELPDGGGEATVTITELTKTKLDDLKAGFGAFGGVRYWVNPTVAVGGEIEYFGAKSEGSAEGTVKFPEVTPVYGGKTVDVSIDGSISASVTGFSGACAFKASPELTVFASAGYYYLNGEVGVKADAEVDEETGSGNLGDLIDEKLKGLEGKSKFTDKGLGFKAGVAFAYPVADELSIVGRAAYRSLKFDEIEFDKKDDLPEGAYDDVQEALKDEVDFSGLELGLGIVYNF